MRENKTNNKIDNSETVNIYKDDNTRTILLITKTMLNKV